MPNAKREQVLSVRDLDITFKTTAGPVHAIRGVNIDLYKGETVALVGESGSGKSVTMKAAMGILAQNAKVNSGSIQFSYHHADGSPETVDLLQKDKKWIRRHINGKRIAMVFQDPMTSLDPTMTIGKQIMEGMLWHFKMPKAEAYQKALKLLEEVGITDAEKRMKSYPHQLSGGMRQRVVIAIALSCDPDLLICDEPTTALDVTIQAKILELIRSIQKERGISVIYITHDLGVVAKVADYVDVMYVQDALRRQVDELDVELHDVVPDHRVVAAPAQEVGQHGVQRRCRFEHVRRDAGQLRDERIEIAHRIDQLLIGVDGLAVDDLHRSELDDGVPIPADTGGFQIQYDIIVGQCPVGQHRCLLPAA